MAKAFNQKMKILYLMQLLMEQTDENHVLNMQQILQMLEEKEIRAERKSIYDDLEVLRNFGLDIRFRKGQPSGYYLTERNISFAEIQKIIQYLPVNEESEAIVHKLKGLVSVYEAEQIVLPEQKPEKSVTAVEEVIDRPGEKKEIKLLFMEKYIPAVEAHPDRCEDAKEHKSGLYKIKMETVVDEAFYGWLVSLGYGIKIVKPKNEAEAYRAYLKKLLKQYK